MNNITITEKYALCMLKERGKLYGSELTPHLLISMIIEMMLDGNLEITDSNKVILNSKEPDTEYNKNLWKIIKDFDKKEVKIKDIITNICYNFTSKKMKSVIEPLKDVMLQSKLISLENKKGIVGNKEIIVLNDFEFTRTIEEIRAELLEDGKLTDDTILLGALLNASKFLKNIFTKYEKNSLSNRLEELKNSDIGKKVKIAQATIDEMTTAMLILVSTIN